MVTEQALLGFLAPHHTGRHHPDEARQIPSTWARIERAQDRLGERVADDRDRPDTLALDRVEQLDGIEGTTGQGDDAPTAAERRQTGEVAGAVHLGASRQERRGRSGERPADVGEGSRLVQRVAEGRGHLDGEVVLTPHDALRHTGRSAGVQHVEVVARATPRGNHALRRRLCRILVRCRPVWARAAPVVDPQPHLHLREAGTDRLDRVGERSVEDDAARVGVVPQVEQLVGGVSVVRVDRDKRALERREHRLHVLRAVVQVLSDGLLALEPGVEQPLRDAVGAAVGFSPRPVQVTVDECDGVGQFVSDDFPDVGEVPFPHGPLV